jgi:hypothetical protein
VELRIPHDTPPHLITPSPTFGHSSQFPEIVGFYTDNKTGFTHGFLDVEGVQLTTDDPKGVKGITTPTQNLLGINNNDLAVGFWTANPIPPRQPAIRTASSSFSTRRTALI